MSQTEHDYSMNYIMLKKNFHTERFPPNICPLKFWGSLSFTILTPLQTSDTGDSGKAFTA